MAIGAKPPAAKVEINDSINDLTRGSKVWYKKDEQTWIAGELASAPAASCTILLETGQTVTVPSTLLQPANAQLQDGIPDLTQLSYLNEPSILFDLQHRYAQDQIYTFAGPVLIAVNPCKDLPLYTNEMAHKYKKGAKVYVNDLDPHIYLVAAAAFREMVREGKSQSLIVSGESGAGKTETTKKAMQYFATLAGGTGIEDQVLETNPILEAFGNAKTMRNHNSSRFGKLIEIHFNSSHHIAGARIRTYLLEKSRVVYQLQGERSYHIFYQLVRGASPEQRKMYHLPTDVTAFNYLAQSGCVDVETMDDAEEFGCVQRALTELGVSDGALHELWAVLAGVLWLGNIQFVANKKDDSAQLLASDAVNAACELLGVSQAALQRALCTRKIKTKDEEITTVLSCDAARDTRDALAKSVYAGVFNWVVAQVNRKLDTGRGMGRNCIAILDIYGFEQFQRNSFEQLCINYANERLQQQFNRHLFELEQAEYLAEGIDWAQVEFTDNQSVLDVIEAQPPKGLGVLAVLDAQCKFPKATDITFLDKLKECMSSHSHFGLVPRCPEDFVIKHYAGAVQYNCTAFLDKNKDTLSSDLVETLMGSSQKMVAEMGGVLLEEGGDKKGTVGSRFSAQLRELVALLDTTGLHFVRCIKPNALLKPETFHSHMALQQLRCCGVLEVVRIARAGFPTRYLVPEFLERYGMLLPGGQHKGDAPLASIQRLIDMFSIPEGQYQIGRTKIFFRAGILGYVEDYWARMHRSASALQCFFRMVVARKRYLRQRAAALLVQAGVRATKARRAYNVSVRRHRAALVIQQRWHAYQTRCSYLTVRYAALTIQRYFWRWQLNRVFRKQRLEREEREEAARLAEEERKRREESFEAMQREFGVDISDIKIALAAYLAAGKDPANLNTMNIKLQNALVTQPSLAQAADVVPAVTPRIHHQPSAPPPAPAPAPTPEPAPPTPRDARTPEPPPQPERPASPTPEERMRMLELQRLQLENQKLQKKLQTERSLREQNVGRLQEQAQEWVNEVRMMQDYIRQLEEEKQQREAEALATPPPPPAQNGFHPTPDHPHHPDHHPGSNNHTPQHRTPHPHNPHHPYPHAHRDAPGSSAGGSSCGDESPSPLHPPSPMHPPSPLPASPASPFLRLEPTPANREADSKYAAQLAEEFGHAAGTMEDDVKFLLEVKRGIVAAPGCDPLEEVVKLRRKFKIWKHDFQERLKTAEDAIRKIDRVQRQMSQQPSPALTNGSGRSLGASGRLSVDSDERRAHRTGILGRLLSHSGRDR